MHWNSILYLVPLTDVYLSLNGTVIPNHGYVEIDDVGSTYDSYIGSTDDSALLCHTNRPPPPDSAHSEGDWFAPDGDRVGSNPPVPGFTRNRGPMVVRLKRTSGTAPEGIYQCTIDDAASTRQIVYVGIYRNGG